MNNDQTSSLEITIRDAFASDVPRLAEVDHLAAAGDPGRRAAIQQWVTAASMRVALTQAQVIGYCVTEYTFFGQAFITMLMVARNARGQGVGTRLLLDAQQRRNTTKMFTSTNLSNQPMQRLVIRLGWQSAGIVYGLDETDPELFFLAPAEDAPGCQVLPVT
jgi:ribosomal protein S18 acetylase RimI-like enzyme